MTYLDDLNLGHCKLTTPPILTGCKGLQYLSLYLSEIEAPPVLSDCLNLKRLFLHSCQKLSTAPVLSGMYSLQEVIVDNTLMDQAAIDSILTTLTGSNFAFLALVSLKVKNSVVPTAGVKSDFMAAHSSCVLNTN